MLAAADWLGTLPTWLVLVGVISMALVLRGGQVGPALGYLRDANATLESENRELKTHLSDIQAEVAALKTRTDLEPLQAALVGALTHHEERAQARFDQTTVILAMVAERLGSNHE